MDKFLLVQPIPTAVHLPHYLLFLDLIQVCLSRGCIHQEWSISHFDRTYSIHLVFQFQLPVFVRHHQHRLPLPLQLLPIDIIIKISMDLHESMMKIHFLAFIDCFSSSLSALLDAQRPKKPHIKKPLNAFMLYMKEQRARVIEECTLKESSAINKVLGQKWKELPRAEQDRYYGN